jgi:hypothetical protein
LVVPGKLNHGLRERDAHTEVVKSKFSKRVNVAGMVPR